jgi:hypothetical protein
MATNSALPNQREFPAHPCRSQLPSGSFQNFRPFTSPVPLLLMRRAVISDWKFFLNNEDWFRLWARRYGESAVEALANELRPLP